MIYTAKPPQNPKANKKAKLEGLAKRLKAKLAQCPKQFDQGGMHSSRILLLRCVLSMGHGGPHVFEAKKPRKARLIGNK